MSRNVTDLELPVKERALELVERARIELGVRVIITQTLRTPEEQAHLYAKGRTLPGPVITNAKPGYSWHNFGFAFDVAFLTKSGKLTYDGPWDKLGAIGESLGLVWGGRMDIDKQKPGNQSDRPHFEYHPAGITLAALRAKLRPSEEIKWS